MNAARGSAPPAPRSAALLEALLPGLVQCAESASDPVDAGLYPEEERSASGAPAERAREFATGRHCARTALARLGVPPAPIPSSEAGAPLWPPGFVGSITHCPGYRAAAVARTAGILTIGIDAEPAAPLPDGVLKLVSLPEERDQLAELARRAEPVPWDTLLFSAKESVYKAWFPLTGKWLGFRDAQIIFTGGINDPIEGINADHGTFDARLLVAGPMVEGSELLGFTGRWLARDGLVLTAIAVPAAASVSDVTSGEGRSDMAPV